VVESHGVDGFDRRLLHALQLDGRAAFARIGEVLGVSDQTVARRYRRLRAECGLRVVGMADDERLGRTRWLLRLRCTPDAAETIGTALARRADTAWVGLTSGGTELMCVTRARNRHERDALLLGKLPRTPSIVAIGAHLVLHSFFGGPLGWYAKSDALTEEEQAALRRPAPEPADGPLRLDAHDEALVATLTRDGRATHPELCRATGLSESAVKRRLAHLRATGALYFDVQFDWHLLGIETTAVLWATVAPGALDTVGRTLAGHHETAFVAATTGACNLVAVVLCRDTPALYTYVSKRIGGLEGVRQVETAPSLRQIKQLTYETHEEMRR
jgi:DNA-binding Lrp family transcriptional regulator